MAENIKYINADELYINLDIMKNPDTEFATDDYIDGFSDGISAAIKELEAFPTADVAPVRHGHWIAMGDCGITSCSCCGWNIEECIEDEYCRECGAKMDVTK